MSMLGNKEKENVELALRSLFIFVYIKVEGLSKLFSNFDTKRFFHPETQARLSAWERESKEFQNLAALKERFISMKWDWERVENFNKIVAQIKKMQTLNYNQVEQDTLSDMLLLLTIENKDMLKFNETYADYLKKNNLEGFKF